MTDLTTIEEVQAGGYTVRVGQNESGGYDAVVIEAPGDGETTTSIEPNSMFYSSGLDVSFSKKNSESVDHAPAMTAPHRWVAVGYAIEAYQFAAIDDGESIQELDVSVSGGLSGVSVDADDVVEELMDDE